MKKILFLLPLITLTACATWQGKSDTMLIAHFGLPTQHAKTPDGEIYQYTDCDNGGTSVYMGNGITVNSPGGCQRRMFLIQDHVVTKDMGTVYH
jgi:hypothetical protein